mgnify:FL=1
MSIQIGINSLEALCKQFDARQVVLFDSDLLDGYPQLSENEKTKWQVYAKLHLSLNNSTWLHAFSTSSEPTLVLVSRLSPTSVLFLLHPFTTRIKTLKKTHLTLREYLFQPEPDLLTQTVLQLGVDDLKRPAPKPTPQPDQFLSIFSDLDKSAPSNTQPIIIK